MVYYKVVFDDRKPTKDNHYPIVIRITNNRKSTTFTTGVRIKQEHWDAVAYQVSTGHPNYLSLNKKITEFFLKVQKAGLELESKEDFEFDILKELINGKPNSKLQGKNISFKEYADQLIADMFSINKTGNAIVYQTATNRLMAYANNPKLRFIDITYSFLEGFKRTLTKDKVKTNSISNYFRTIRAIYNKAIKAKLIDRTHYPFLDISIKTEKTAKRAISTQDLMKVESATLKIQSPTWHARNFFFISFSLIGASFTDLAYLKPENIKKGRLIYRRRKTGKELSIKLHPFALKLLNNYIGSNEKYLLPILPIGTVEDSKRAKVIILQWIKTTNKYLERLARQCEITDEITTYVARHSWATSAKRLGYSIELIAEGLGHEYGNKITNIYLDAFDQTLIDEVNEKVIDLLK